MPLDGYLRYRGAFYRAPEALVHQRVTPRVDRDFVWIARGADELARYPRSYEVWHLVAAAAASARAATCASTRDRPRGRFARAL